MSRFEDKQITLTHAEVLALRACIRYYSETEQEKFRKENDRGNKFWVEKKYYDGGKIEERMWSVFDKLKS